MGKNNFAKNLLTLRLNNKLTQDDLAAKLVMTRQTISSYERGESVPDIETLLNICDFFDISSNKLLRGDLRHTYNLSPELNNNLMNENYISSISEPGLYYIVDDDMEKFFNNGMIRIELDLISAICYLLSRKSYIITDMFSSGFSIYLRDRDEVKNFKKSLYNLIDDYIHGDNHQLDEIVIDRSNILGKTYNHISKKTLSSIYGCDIQDLKYYWKDEDSNIRGYGRTKEECLEAAKLQNCNIKYIKDIDFD